LINVNDGLITHTKELSEKNNMSNNNNQGLEEQLKKIESEKYNLEDDLSIIKGKFDYESKETLKLENKNKELNHKLKQLLSYLRTYHLESKEFKSQNWNLIDKLNFFYDQGYLVQHIQPNEENMNNMRDNMQINNEGIEYK